MLHIIVLGVIEKNPIVCGFPDVRPSFRTGTEVTICEGDGTGFTLLVHIFNTLARWKRSGIDRPFDYLVRILSRHVCLPQNRESGDLVANGERAGSVSILVDGISTLAAFFVADGEGFYADLRSPSIGLYEILGAV